MVVGRELRHMVFDGDFPGRRVVELYGEGGVTLSCEADMAVLPCQSASVSKYD